MSDGQTADGTWRPAPPPPSSPSPSRSTFPPGQIPYGHPGYKPPPGAPMTMNGFALASLVCGIFGVFGGITTIPAIIFGSIAKSQIPKRNQTGNGMATAGLILGWIGVALTVAVICIWFVASANRTAQGG